MNIGIVGHFGDGFNLLNGQTVKTQNLYNGLSKYTNHQLAKVDTHGWSKHPIKLLGNLRKAFRECDAVIMLTAHNGVKVFPKLFQSLKKKYGTKIYYDVVGGWLPELINENKNLLGILKYFDGIWVETSTMKLALEKCGLSNVTVVPNFKELNPLKEQELKYPSGVPFRLCTFSRVMKEKGIGTIAEVIKSINESAGYAMFSLDIYGQIQAGEEEWFENLRSGFPEYIQYKGCVDSKKSVDAIKDYFALVFPTHFYTEGVPGTIIDAYCAGVPVISAKWESYADVVDEGVTGFGYEFDNIDELKQLLLSISEEPQKVLNLRKSCLVKAEQFAPERIVTDIEKITGGGYNIYPLKFCTFSRVMEEKGVEDAIAAVKAVNKVFGFTACELDIYGQVWKTYESRFDEIKKDFNEEIRYCGCVDSTESVNVLKQYFALLFPTHYEGEGFAGTLIDAFSAGIPVVASDWKYNKEIVSDAVGYVYHTGNNKELEAIMIDLCKHPQKAISMKKRCLMEADKYKADRVIRQIDELMN